MDAEDTTKDLDVLDIPLPMLTRRYQRELKATGKSFRAFEVLNLGRYERQAYLNIFGRLSGKKKESALARKEQEFRDLILKAYRAESLGGGSFQPVE